MLTCYLCEFETCYVSRFCPKCRALKHLILLHGDRVHEIVNEVLCRTEEKQNNKIKQQLNKEIEEKKKVLDKKIHGPSPKGKVNQNPQSK